MHFYGNLAKAFTWWLIVSKIIFHLETLWKLVFFPGKVSLKILGKHLWFSFISLDFAKFFTHSFGWAWFSSVFFKNAILVWALLHYLFTRRVWSPLNLLPKKRIITSVFNEEVQNSNPHRVVRNCPQISLIILKPKEINKNKKEIKPKHCVVDATKTTTGVFRDRFQISLLILCEFKQIN